jgi:hypothetical protein
LPILRIVSGLSVDIEIHFINAGLPFGTWLGVPRPRAQLDMVELLYGKATPDTATLGYQGPDSITTPSELIAEDIPSAGLSSSNMRAKQPRLSIIGGCYRLPANCRTSEEFVYLAHGPCFGRFRCHITSGYAYASSPCLKSQNM